MDTSAINECTRLSFADTPFPEVVRRLGLAGVRAYHADLIRLHKTYYDDGSSSYDGALPLSDAPRIAGDFQQDDLIASLRAIQRGDIGYAEFLRRIMRAGCASYSVFIGGRKAIYFGRDGQFLIENFPRQA